MELPGGDGHLLDEHGLDGAGGLPVGEKGFEQSCEGLRVLGGEDGFLGGEAVLKGVEAHGGASFRGCGAGVFLGVGAVGAELAFGRHG
ncbi:MAG: hypothetical protein HY238_17440 [Acidobacteria bacterium]|nr:hypothetical protein [Acidobacteriota bacterium]